MTRRQLNSKVKNHAWKICAAMAVVSMLSQAELTRLTTNYGEAFVQAMLVNMIVISGGLVLMSTWHIIRRWAK